MKAKVMIGGIGGRREASNDIRSNIRKVCVEVHRYMILLITAKF